MALQRALTQLLLNTLDFNLNFDTDPLGELGQVSPLLPLPSPMRSSTAKLAFPAEHLGR